MQCSNTRNRSSSGKQSRQSLRCALRTLFLGSLISTPLYADYIAPMWFNAYYKYGSYHYFCHAAPDMDPHTAAQNCADRYNTPGILRHHPQNLTVGAQTDQGDFWIYFACGGHYNRWNRHKREYETVPCEEEQFWYAAGFCPEDEDGNSGTPYDIAERTCIYPSTSDSCTLTITAPANGTTVFTDTPAIGFSWAGSWSDADLIYITARIHGQLLYWQDQLPLSGSASITVTTPLQPGLNHLTVTGADSEYGGNGTGCTATDQITLFYEAELDKPAKQRGRPAKEHCEGNPCDVATGNKYQRELDYQNASGTLQFIRYYNSQAKDIDLGLGRGWSSNLSRRLSVTDEQILVRQADGRSEAIRKEDGQWHTDPDSTLQVSITEEAIVIPDPRPAHSTLLPARTTPQRTTGQRPTTPIPIQSSRANHPSHRPGRPHPATRIRRQWPPSHPHRPGLHRARLYRL